MKNFTRAGLAACALWTVGASAADAAIIVSLDARVKVGFINIEERTAETPRGMDGLGVGASMRSLSVLPGSGMDGPDFSYAFEQLESLGGTWVLESGMHMNLPGPGSLTETHQRSLDLVFENLTGGASVYGIDLQIEWELRYRVFNGDPMTDTAFMFASGYGSQHVGLEQSLFGGPVVSTNGSTAETVVRSISNAHFEVGRTEANAGADTVTIQLVFTSQGYVGSPVPSASAMGVLGVGLIVASGRRRGLRARFYQAAESRLDP